MFAPSLVRLSILGPKGLKLFDADLCDVSPRLTNCLVVTVVDPEFRKRLWRLRDHGCVRSDAIRAQLALVKLSFQGAFDIWWLAVGAQRASWRFRLPASIS